MSFTMFVTWVLVGVLAGVLAGLAMKRGGYGLKKDIILGLVGAIGLSWIFRAVGLFPQAGIVAMAFVAAVGAGHPIAGQRQIRPSGCSTESSSTSTPRGSRSSLRTGGPNRPSSSLRTAASGSIQGRKRPRPWTWSFPSKR